MEIEHLAHSCPCSRASQEYYREKGEMDHKEKISKAQMQWKYKLITTKQVHWTTQYMPYEENDCQAPNKWEKLTLL